MFPVVMDRDMTDSPGQQPPTSSELVEEVEFDAEDLYAFLDDALAPEAAAAVQAAAAQSISVNRALARVEQEYRSQILAHLSGEDVPLPPSSTFVREAVTTLALKLQAHGTLSLEHDGAALSPAVRAILAARIPEHADTSVEAFAPASSVFLGEDEEA